MKRKTFIILLALTAALACASGLAACDKEKETPHTHEYGEWVTETPATCTDSGERRRYCSCGEYETEEIFALGHVIENHKGQEPTCTENGWSDYQTCKREGCEYTTYEIIPARHVYLNGYCINCGKPQSDYELLEDGTYAFSGVGDLEDKEVIIPSTVNGIPVTAVSGFALHENDNVTRVVIPEGVKEIGGCAFEKCENLTSVVIPSTVTAIGVAAFADCGKLKNVEIPDSVTFIGDDAFFGCDSLEYNVNGNGSYLGSEANPYLVLAKADNSLSSFEIGAETRIIFSSAFSGCENLKRIIIPDTVTQIGGDIFDGCVGLEYVKLPYGLTEIGNSMFYGCARLTEIEIPESVTFIGDSAFEGCTALESITIPASVQTLGGSAFASSGLRNIIFQGNAIEEINGYTFSGCENLESVVIAEGVTMIDDYILLGCTNLKWIYLPASIKTVGQPMFDFFENADTVIYYGGTEEEWNLVNIDYRDSYDKENIYFYLAPGADKPVSGNYWQWGTSGNPEPVKF